MQNAIILGEGRSRGDKELNHKPSIYKTVVSGHPTSVYHPIRKFENAVLPSEGAQALLPIDPTHEFPVRVIHGDLLTPAKIETSSSVQGEGSFKRDEKMENQIHHSEEIIFTQAKEDVNRITSKLRNAKGLKKKLKVLQEGKKSLEKETSDISGRLEKDVSKLVQAKE